MLGTPWGHCFCCQEGLKDKESKSIQILRYQGQLRRTQLRNDLTKTSSLLKCIFLQLTSAAYWQSHSQKEHCSFRTTSSLDYPVLKANLSSMSVLKPREFIICKTSPAACFITSFVVCVGLGVHIKAAQPGWNQVYSLTERSLSMKCLRITFLIPALFQAVFLGNRNKTYKK